MSNKIRQPYSNNAFGLTRAKIHNFQYRTHVGIGLLMKILPAGLTACDENNILHAMVLPVPADLTACDENNMSHAMVLPVPADLTACSAQAKPIEQQRISQ